PDGVIVCIGPRAHAELAPQVLAKGYPCYTEKPPAPTASEALGVARAAKAAGLLCTTAFKKRYNIAYSRARQWLEGFPPEDRYSLSIDYASAAYSEDPASTAFLHDFALHVLDLTGYLFGEIRRVFAFAKGGQAYAVSVEFACGAVGALNLTDGRSFTLPTEEVELTLRGGNFMTIHNSSIWRITENGKAAEWREPPTFVAGGDSGRETGHLAEIEDFFAAVREGRTTRSNIYESYKSLVFFEGVLESVRTGRVVELAYEPL
ncbi:MAG TPA: Gfo/Idh/MocA family oxidoreductase, partial [Candidatus Sumerlaeota bacterium]|nr:Gfo/Idh/MocA family oxidoreductase [Candidatus Sumerlaeota bacterium]